jgi:protein TonB
MPAFRLWTLLVSLAAHGALLLLLLHSSPDDGAQDMGVGGVEVALSPAGGPAGSVAAVQIPAAEVPDPVETATPIEAPEAPAPVPPTEVAPVPPEEAEPAVPDAAEAATVREPAESPTEEATDPPPAAADMPPALAEVPPVEAARPEPPPEQAARPEIAQARSPEPEAVPSRQAAAVPPSPAKPAPPGDSSMAAAEPAPEAAMPDPGAGHGGMGEQAAVGADAGGAGGGTPGVRPDYLDVLRAWLERHKEYPRQAQLRRQEGTALLRFVIDRAGHVLSHRIERSSGHASLDAAVLAMLERARPLPAMPPDMARARLEVAVPVTFELR